MTKYSVNDVVAQSEVNGGEKVLRRFLALAEAYDLPLHPRPFSIQIAPPQNKSIALLTIWCGGENPRLAPANGVYVEVIIEASKSGTRWDKYMGISTVDLMTSLTPFFSLYEYDYAGVHYKVLRKNVDNADIGEAISRLGSILSQAR